jgi:hypothetical protein
MGFFGYWLKTDNHQSLTTVQVPVKEPGGGQPNLMVKSDEYLTKFLTRFNVNRSDNPKTEPITINNSRKPDEALPVLANNFTPAELVFCFPEGSHTGTLQSIIARYRSGLKTSFAGVKEIPVMEGENWEAKLGQIMNQEQQEKPPVLIGLNLIQNAYSDFSDAGVSIHFYLGLGEQGQGTLLPQVITRFSSNLNTFTLEKLNFDGREVFKITWNETTEHLTGLERNMEFLIKTLEQILELRIAKKI